MASYWKSPYKEKTHSDTVSAALLEPAQVVPIGSRPYCGLNKVKHSWPVTPQDWFDWAFSVSNMRPITSTLRHTKAEIKGILKTPVDEITNDEERPGNDTESNGSSRSEIGGSRREKKRVTFDESNATETSGSLKLHHSSPTMLLNNRLKQIHPLNGFPKHRSGQFPKLKKLPAVVKEETSKPQVEKNEPKTSSTCKHIPDLRCANCVSSLETETLNDVLFSPKTSVVVNEKEDNQLTQDSQRTNSVTPTPECSNSWSKQRNSQSTQLLQQHSAIEKKSEMPREPSKKYKPHWTKTFTRYPKRRQYPRLTQRRNYSTTNTISSKNNSAKSGSKRTEENKYFSEDFSKLHVSGNGKLVQTKLQAQEITPGPDRNIYGHLKTPKSTLTSFNNRYDSKLTPRPKSFTQPAPITRGSSAPGRLGDDIDHDGTDFFMDKTSQIISWLKDIKSKNVFKPRNTRTYASGPTHLR